MLFATVKARKVRTIKILRIFVKISGLLRIDVSIAGDIRRVSFHCIMLDISVNDDYIFNHV